MAENIMQTWYEAAKKRVSVRSYSAPVDREMFYVLKSSALKLNNDEARIDLRAKNGVLGKIPVLSSVIGGVDGTNCFATIIVKKGCEYMGGYIGEAFILECVSRGLATCWLGATYKKSVVKQVVEVLDDEKIIAVISALSRRPQAEIQEKLKKLWDDLYKAGYLELVEEKESNERI